ncbi:hypothetical protein PoB_002331600 [Plakobranchus ocellatus]|uniref:Uncharacterized protein n=1 Tax=Plakobranchus ocellatus TaxID=259542 RepID=A0AAV3ZLI9_9GAST|nr:hypothetical protein PoB_002331600 [Plakobranchus ocellatus]
MFYKVSFHSRHYLARDRKPRQKSRKFVLSDDFPQPSDVLYGDIQYLFAKRNRHSKRYRKERKKLQKAKKRQDRQESLWSNMDPSTFYNYRHPNSGNKRKRTKLKQNTFNDLWIRTEQISPRYLEQMGDAMFVQRPPATERPKRRIYWATYNSGSSGWLDQRIPVKPLLRIPSVTTDSSSPFYTTSPNPIGCHRLLILLLYHISESHRSPLTPHPPFIPHLRIPSVATDSSSPFYTTSPNPIGRHRLLIPLLYHISESHRSPLTPHPPFIPHLPILPQSSHLLIFPILQFPSSFPTSLPKLPKSFFSLFLHLPKFRTYSNIQTSPNLSPFHLSNFTNTRTPHVPHLPFISIFLTSAFSYSSPTLTSYIVASLNLPTFPAYPTPQIPLFL